MSRRRPYPDCIRPDGNCASCAMSISRRDCHNNRINIIRYHRQAAGLTQKQLAERSGLGHRWIQKLENGEILPGNILLRNAVALIEALEIAPEELLYCPEMEEVAKDAADMP